MVAVFLLLPGCLWAASLPAAPQSLSDDETLKQAVTTFHKGMAARATPGEAAFFRQAAAGFEELRRRGVQSPALFLDLGNAYLLSGDVPQAILAYRRGLRLAANDRTLRANLAYARDQVAYPSPDHFGRPAGDFWPPWLPRLTPGLTWVLLVCAYSTACLLATCWWMTRHGRLMLAGAGAFTLAVVLGAVLAVQAWQSYQEDRHPSVVIAVDDVLLRKGNGLSYPPRYDTPVNRGVEARLRYARGSWLQVELAGGEVGWVPHSACLVDVPE
ncbi:MAG TPA: hypothetical protein VG013_06455 [Gemmataceae bacterium]|nr:hypothetical protein [Gemmataceae bacterium]